MFFSTIIWLAAVFVPGVWAQSDTAQCAAGFDWNKNSLDQDPCVIGSMLYTSCRDLEHTSLPLNGIHHHNPPGANDTDDLKCDCNTVVYSLYMACASCQGGQIYSWVQWTLECDTTYVAQYPADIAQGTAVPYWAYNEVTSLPDETWNETVAMRIGRNPEQLPKPPTTDIPSATEDVPSSTGDISETGFIVLITIASCSALVIVLLVAILVGFALLLGSVGSCIKSCIKKRPRWKRARPTMPNQDPVQEEDP